MTLNFPFANQLKTLLARSSKIRLADNKRLTDAEYDKVCRLCDIFAAVADAAGQEAIAPPAGGVFWNKARSGMGPFELYLRKDRKEIDHLFLLFNAFRDFCALAYEYDHYTPSPDYWVRRYQRLSRAMPKRWRVRLPARFGEIGWRVNGYPVNRWTSVNQERLTAITLAGVTKYLENQDTPRILELGGGAGEMGYVFSKALPGCTWYDVDLLGCLIYSTIQLAINLPQKQHYIYVGNLSLKGSLDEQFILRSPKEAVECSNAIVNIPHFLLDDFRNQLNLHFAYNTYSMGEMPSTAVKHYTLLLANFLRKQGIFFEQNGYFPERGGDNAESIIATQFKAIRWDKDLDGRWFPNGPIHFWCNNLLDEEIAALISPRQRQHLITSLQDGEDKLDIQFPNERMWEQVYELFTPNQVVKDLFPW